MPVTAVPTTLSPGRVPPSGPKVCVQSAHWYVFYRCASSSTEAPPQLSTREAVAAWTVAGQPWMRESSSWRSSSGVTVRSMSAEKKVRRTLRPRRWISSGCTRGARMPVVWYRTPGRLRYWPGCGPRPPRRPAPGGLERRADEKALAGHVVDVGRHIAVGVGARQVGVAAGFSGHGALFK